MLAHHSRIVFATTEHGFTRDRAWFSSAFQAGAGSGNGLAGAVPGRAHSLEPARPSGAPDLPPARPRCRHSGAAVAEGTSWRPGGRRPSWLTMRPLLNRVFRSAGAGPLPDQPQATQAFAGGPDLDIHLLEQEEALLGVALVAREGNISPALARDIWAGGGVPRSSACPSRCWPTPASPRRGIALRQGDAHRHSSQPASPGIGFPAAREAGDTPSRRGASTIWDPPSPPAPPAALLAQRGMQVLRIGLQRDAASGSHAALLLKPLHRLRRRAGTMAPAFREPVADPACGRVKAAGS